MEPYQSSSLSPASANGNNSNGNSANGNSSFPKPAFAPPPDPASMLTAWQLNALQEEESDLRSLLTILRRRAWIIAGVAAVVMAVMGARTLHQPKIYEGRFRVLVEPVNAKDDLSELSSVLGDQLPSKPGLDYETQVQVLRSPELVEPVAKQLRQTYPELDYLTLLKNLNISRLGDTKILEVHYASPDPVKIQIVLDQLSEAYLKYSLEARQTNLRQGINFVENQLPDLQAQVDSLQDQLESFRRQYDFITPDMQSSQLSEQTNSLNEQRLTLDRDLSGAQQALTNLQAENGALGALDDAPVYQQLLSELRSVETTIAEELTRFTPNSLAIRVLKERRENILPLLQQEAERVVEAQQAIALNSLQVMEVQSNTLAEAEQQTAQGLTKLPSLIRRYTDLERELAVSTETLTRFRLTRETLEIEAAQTEIPWQLIEVPVQPTEPISPDLKRALILSIAASLLAGLGAALLLEKLDNVYHAIDELKAGTKLPLLGTLPFNSALRERSSIGAGAIARLSEALSKVHLGRLQLGGRKSNYYSYGSDSESSFLEALRVLHTNLRMISSDRPIRSVIVSSALPGDGKSTVCAHLAQVAAAMGQRVLVVDVDLRQPQVHERLQLSNELGLSNLIADDLPLQSVMQQVTPTEQLFVLTAGKIPPDPTKLLASQKMKQLMETFSRCFDLVLYDAPPAAGLADVSLIGQQSDGLVLVTRMGKTDRTVLKQTIETLKLAQIATLGIVANGVKASGGYCYYAYGHDVAFKSPASMAIAHRPDSN